MYDFILNEWYGRFGNNLKQLSNAIYIAQKTNSKLSFIKHKLIKDKEFDFSNKNTKLLKIETNFWKDKIAFFNLSEEEIEKHRPDILQNLVHELLPFKEKDVNYDIVIHFRGGDIWQKSPHNAYVQCPLSYFYKIFKIEKPKKILLVCEDKSNPIIKILLNNKDFNVTYQSSNIENDINTLLNSKIIIKSGVSTFIDVISQSSKKLNTFYMPMFDHDKSYQVKPQEIFNINSKISKIFIKDYIRIGDWKADKDQINLLINT